MAKLAPRPCPGDWEWHKDEGSNSWGKRTDVLFEELQKKSSAVNIDKGEVVGILLQFPIADGYACYVVSKARPLTLQHVPISDAWQIPMAYLRGIRKNDVLLQAHRRREIAKLFSKKG